MLSDADRIIKHLARHIKYAKIVINFAYPFNEDELRKYSEILDWEIVSMNSNINWTETLYQEFKNKLDVGGLSSCHNFPWTEKFIDDHIEELFYDFSPEGELEKTDFARNRGLPWSEEFMEKYTEHWNWMWLSLNESIPFTQSLIDRFSDRWYYDSLEYNKRIIENESLKSYLNIFYDCNVKDSFHNCEFCFKGEEILEEYKGRGYSLEFCWCTNFNWASNFASKLKKALKSKQAGEIIARNIRWTGPFYHWSIDVLDAFEEFWDYDTLNFVPELDNYIGLEIARYGYIDKIIELFQRKLKST